MSERFRELRDETGNFSSPVRRAFVASSATDLNLVAVDEIASGSKPIFHSLIASLSLNRDSTLPAPPISQSYSAVNGFYASPAMLSSPSTPTH